MPTSLVNLNASTSARDKAGDIRSNDKDSMDLENSEHNLCIGRNFIIRFLTLLVAICVGTHSVVLAQTSTQSLELMVLGSGGPGAFGRAASCYLVLVGGTARILVDAGPGAFARLGEAKLSLSDTDIVLLTHLHIDHAGELPGLFKARAAL